MRFLLNPGIEAAPRPAKQLPVAKREPQCPFLDYAARGFWFLRTRAPSRIILPFFDVVKRAANTLL
jgi:hypothetical protein